MTKLTFSLTLSGAVAALASPGLSAQSRKPAGSAPDLLDAVVAEALRHNRRLAQERLTESAAEARVREARGRLLPSLTLDGRYTEQSGTVDVGDFVNPAYAALNELSGADRFPTDLSVTLPLRHESRIRIVQPLFDEAIRAGYSASRHQLESRKARRRAAARELAAEAQTTFLNVSAARGLRRTWESTLTLVAEAERVAQRLVDAGTATPDAVFRARAERSDVEQRLREAREREAAAARTFNQLVGRPLDAEVDSLDEAALDLPFDLSEEDAVRSALARREELHGLDAARGAAEARVRAASSAFLPNVAVAVDWGFQGRELDFGRDHDYWTASLLMSWNLFSGGSAAARRDVARLEAERLGLERDETEDLVRLDVRQAWRAARVARDAIESASDRLAAASRTFELVRRRYEEGLAAPIDFLDARAAFTNAELNRVVTIHRYAVRWVELERAAALRDPEDLESSSWK